MNSVHDMGGMHGMGPVAIEADEPVFHHQWEARVFSLRLACAFHRKWNADMGRYARERIPPAQYLSASYYELGLFQLEMLLVEQGLVTAKELETGRAGAATSEPRVLGVQDVPALARSRRRPRVDADVAPKFKAGDPVVARNIHPVGHTRLPRYARGRRGVIDSDHGVFTFADTNAMTRDPKPQHMYSVRFTARELWGADASPRDSVYLALWDDHLDPA
jgi:nitrile hydratase beta subunit